MLPWSPPPADADYTSIEDYGLSFASGSPVGTLSCVAVSILEDTAVEDTERFDVELSVETDPVNLLSPNSAAVFISDQDGKTTLSGSCMIGEKMSIVGCCGLFDRREDNNGLYFTLNDCLHAYSAWSGTW